MDKIPRRRATARDYERADYLLHTQRELSFEPARNPRAAVHSGRGMPAHMEKQRTTQHRREYGAVYGVDSGGIYIDKKDRQSPVLSCF